jgi:glycosyltransferase involved in cell wall biosynthesis
MKNQVKSKHIKTDPLPEKLKPSAIIRAQGQEAVYLNTVSAKEITNDLPGILIISTYPPKECGIATYTQDLVKQLNNKFIGSFKIRICPLESGVEKLTYAGEALYTINTNDTEYPRLAATINENDEIKMVLVQHEFGLFAKNENAFNFFLSQLTKPVILVFHTVLPKPDESLKEKVKRIASFAESIVVMTNSSLNILINDYDLPKDKITVIPHGTHLVLHSDKELLKKKYGLWGKKVLSTFGLLGSGKNIESTLDALPGVVKNNPDVLFLIIGKTHPSIINQEGEKYRNMLEGKVKKLHLQNHVKFINQFLPLPELLEYLQLTDIYLFTSRNPNQAVSGTFSYAISSGCPVISTPIPHALEVLQNDAGIIVDFENPKQLTAAVNSLLMDDELRKKISSNALHKMASTAWENAAIAHARLFEKIGKGMISLNFELPGINLDHLKKMTTEFGMIQFSKINHPDIESGFTLDDNSRALIAFCQHYEKTGDAKDLKYLNIYFNFIKYCQQPAGNFLNYVNEQRIFTEQNKTTNLEDANGRTVWALGYMISKSNLLPAEMIADAVTTIQKALLNVNKIHSTRAMAFVIK